MKRLLFALIAALTVTFVCRAEISGWQWNINVGDIQTSDLPKSLNGSVKLNGVDWKLESNTYDKKVEVGYIRFCGTDSIPPGPAVFSTDYFSGKRISRVTVTAKSRITVAFAAVKVGDEWLRYNGSENSFYKMHPANKDTNYKDPVLDFVPENGVAYGGEVSVCMLTNGKTEESTIDMNLLDLAGIEIEYEDAADDEMPFISGLPAYITGVAGLKPVNLSEYFPDKDSNVSFSTTGDAISVDGNGMLRFVNAGYGIVTAAWDSGKGQQQSAIYVNVKEPVDRIDFDVLSGIYSDLKNIKDYQEYTITSELTGVTYRMYLRPIYNESRTSITKTLQFSPIYKTYIMSTDNPEGYEIDVIKANTLKNDKYVYGYADSPTPFPYSDSEGIYNADAADQTSGMNYIQPAEGSQYFLLRLKNQPQDYVTPKIFDMEIRYKYVETPDTPRPPIEIPSVTDLRGEHLKDGNNYLAIDETYPGWTYSAIANEEQDLDINDDFISLGPLSPGALHSIRIKISDGKQEATSEPIYIVTPPEVTLTDRTEQTETETRAGTIGKDTEFEARGNGARIRYAITTALPSRLSNCLDEAEEYTSPVTIPHGRFLTVWSESDTPAGDHIYSPTLRFTPGNSGGLVGVETLREDNIPYDIDLHHIRLGYRYEGNGIYRASDGREIIQTWYSTDGIRQTGRPGLSGAYIQHLELRGPAQQPERHSRLQLIP